MPIRPIVSEGGGFRSSVVWTDELVLPGWTTSDSIHVEGGTKVLLQLGAETGPSTLRLEFSDDDTTWYSHSINSVSGSDRIFTACSLKLEDADTIEIIIPIWAKYLRVKTQQL